MDNNDDKDEKRRVMTPPAEWGGDDGADDFLGGDTDWLSVPEDEPPRNESDAARESEEAVSEPIPEEALHTGLEPELELAPEVASEMASEGELDEPQSSDTRASETPASTAATDDGDLGWLTSDMTAPTTNSDERHSSEDTLAAAPIEREETQTSLGEHAPPEEDDNWLDDAGALDPAPVSDEEPEDDIVGFGNFDQLEKAPEPAPDFGMTTPEATPANQPSSNAVWMTEPDTQEEANNTMDEVSDEPAMPPPPAAMATPASSEALLTDHRAAAEMPPRKLPLWPIGAVVVALILVGIGGWGAFTERTQLQARVAELEGQLARTRKQGDLSPEEEQTLRADNQSLRLQLATLREQYAGMAAEIEGLEQRLLTTGSATTAAEQPEPEPTPAPAAVASTARPEPEPVSSKQAAAPAPAKVAMAALPDTTESGGWFVNIASYSRLDIAEEWANRIRRVADHVTLQDVEVNGKVLHRVRVVGYASKAEAQEAAKALEAKYNTGPLWIGEMAPEDSMPAVKEEADTGSASTTPQASSTPVTLKTASSNGGWFIYVDTYSQGVDADEKAKQISNAGYEAKVAVEYRSGELFYRVQVVGIDSRERGERIVQELAALGDMPNLQLRQY